ncbi:MULTISPECIES: acyl-CoA carboxylase subunit epsilon [Protofrankia]|uniref:Acyl-CoA carboxylase epsilon subunit n=1 Tax=Candidatus Protofrankia datiscae TaxID=2716812 RepID=F8AY31_9ACTN|nr:MULTISPECIES: acyl-CoA carboxylase subunit epsilon [Protofrankia]AEH08532.1 hypothetical protein FsymDg_1028 [Candidatus Protofrankia datiscae]
MSSAGDGRVPRPHLQVVPTNASAEEIAALIAVLCLWAGAAAAPAPPPSAWSDRSATLRRTVHSGPDGWRWTGFTPGTRTRAEW